ncbi:MAG: BamA/TamA family outer membrane protein [Armatimonadetes bacterium]|nr:BamA/TamA family outer membrane protein [Armatimonadota bacterium]NIM23916.1 BamA/TamA family outer membrane protein [Armatimonadota bacterium]NIM66635.1 BamA/TamA family outer membrane protein [Armatimonadota bacterium]NIM76303.1 BamA/TamA family outer membrane protein [Armatimonadota bacterium]NIN05997.1 BamA/TamA family outer membrane protein [Armatimonadota bacterium]
MREAFKSDGDSFLYDERREGGLLTLSRPLGDYSRGFVTVRRDDLRVEDIDDDVDPNDVLFSDQSVRSLALGVVSDTRDIAKNPTKGSRLSFVTETAGMAGGASFDKYIVDLRRYISFGPRPKEEEIAALLQRKVLAFRLLVGTTTGDPPFLEQFLLGGVDTLRGYSPDRFPGEKQALLNFEYRFPLSDTLQGVLFVDTGDAWGGSFAEQYGDTSFKAHTGYGVGIRLQSPIGPLRLDYGTGSEGSEVHFGMGHMF